jgi:hypothetical protein
LASCAVLFRLRFCDAAEEDGGSARPFEDGVEQLGAALF